MSEFDAILAALDSIRKANHDSHNDIRKSIDDGLKAVQKNVDGVNIRLDKLNGNVAELWEESNRRQQAVHDFRRLERNLAGYKKRWLYFVVGAVAFILITVIIYDVVGLRGIVELLK